MQDEAAKQLIKELDREIRGRGHGSIRAVDRAVRRGEGWWQRRVAAGNLELRQLLTVLDQLGLEPSRFVRKVLGDELGLELDRPRGEPPAIVGKAWAHLAEDAAGDLGRSYLDELDRLRYEDPRGAVERADEVVAHVELVHLPLLLGISGSAYRLWGMRLDEAEHAIHAGLGIARAREDQTAVGDLLQRLSYVVANRGEYAEALRIVDKAAVIYLRAGDQVGVGKALVDQGIWLYYLDQTQASIATQKAALEWLPESLPRSRCAAFQVMGLAFQAIGDLKSALRHVALAEEAASGIEDFDRGKIIWIRAKIHADLGQLDQAAECLWVVVEIFRELHLGETALATCELVRIQLLQGQRAEAYRTATTMRALLIPIRHGKIASAAIADLLRCGQIGLSLALVEHAIAQIESERKHVKTWQSLRVTQP